MTILEVMRETVIALFSTRTLEDTLVLKGGSALIFVEGLSSRLSTDVDFSAISKIESPEEYFGFVERALTSHFKTFDLDVFDAKYAARPKIRGEETPPFWGGWKYEFKLSAFADRSLPIERRRIAALVPDGVSSPIIEIDISEHEFTGSTQTVLLGGSKVHSYSSTLLILEKLRAILQQHDSYQLAGKKKHPRGRDFYDIFQLTKKYRHEKDFFQKLSRHIDAVFNAKQVPMELLSAFADESFVSYFRDNFDLSLQAHAEVKDFDFYLENVRLVVNGIRKARD